MKPSPEFEKFGRYFIQDIDQLTSTADEFYDFSLHHFKGEERVRLGAFIDRALETASDDELRRLWDAADSDIYFHTPQDLRDFLKGARDRL